MGHLQKPDQVASPQFSGLFITSFSSAREGFLSPRETEAQRADRSHLPKVTQPGSSTWTQAWGQQQEAVCHGDTMAGEWEPGLSSLLVISSRHQPPLSSWISHISADASLGARSSQRPLGYSRDQHAGDPHLSALITMSQACTLSYALVTKSYV